MSTVVEQDDWQKRTWQGIVSLKPLQKHFDWWFRLIAITTIPALIYCTCVIALDITHPEMLNNLQFWSFNLGGALRTSAGVLINIAIEGAMLGCIALARQAQVEGDEEGRKRYTYFGWGFALLTLLTVGFKVFKINGDYAPILEMTRVGAGILFMLIGHKDEQGEEHQGVSRQQMVAHQDSFDAIHKSIQALTTQLHGLSQTVAHLQNNINQTPNMTMDTQLIEQKVSDVFANFAQDYQQKIVDLQATFTPSLPDVSEQKELLAQMQNMMKTLQETSAKVEQKLEGLEAPKHAPKDDVFAHVSPHVSGHVLGNTGPLQNTPNTEPRLHIVSGNKTTRKLDEKELGFDGQNMAPNTQKTAEVKPTSTRSTTAKTATVKGKVILDKNAYDFATAAKFAKCSEDAIKVAIKDGVLIRFGTSEKVTKTSLKTYLESCGVKVVTKVGA